MKKTFLNIIFIFCTITMYSQGKIELVDLIKKFTPNISSENNIYDWFTGSETNSEIIWITNGLDHNERDDFFREGEVVVSIKGKTIKCLGKNLYPCKWNFKLKGVKNGYTKFSLSSVYSQQLEGGYKIEDFFHTTDYISEIVAMDKLYSSFGFIIYKLKFKNKKNIWIKYSWSCGSGGCSIYLDCYTNSNDIGYISLEE
ncbi:hypothetical protein Q4595_11040 [Wenyingzhuangia sp. 1_MG-2023]|nr:hypothetical protein [Wenyingzhuangia sp. 1_MG-2023]